MQTKCALLFLYNQHKISPQPYYAENLGIQYIGAVLKNASFDVQIINADYQRMGSETIVKQLIGENVGFLGMAPCYLNMGSALGIAEMMKKKSRSILVCLGGHHSTFCCDEILKNEPNIDYIVKGEGEFTALELLQAIESHHPHRPGLEQLLRINGLSFRHEGRIFHNEPRALIGDLDLIPFPARDLIKQARIAQEHAMPLMCWTRGCPNHCSFCSTPNFYGGVWRARSPKNIADEVQSLVEEYGFTQFYLTDDQFAGAGQEGRDHVEGVISEIMRRGLHKDYDLHFFLMVRGDFFRKENEDLISKFPLVGFRDVFIGFESGDTSQLKVYTKGTTTGKYKEAIDLLRKHNIFVEGGFIIFNPYSTFNSLRNDAGFIRDLGVPLLGYYTKQLLAYPGTRLFDKLLKDNMLTQHHYKRIEFRYKDDKIADLHSYLSGFFASVEDLDNSLFESIDFGVKLKAVLHKIDDGSTLSKAQTFLSESEHVYSKITNLNYRFFCDLLEAFEDSSGSAHVKDIERRFLSEYRATCETATEGYSQLNPTLNIIRGGKQCYARM